MFMSADSVTASLAWSEDEVGENGGNCVLVATHDESAFSLRSDYETI